MIKLYLLLITLLIPFTYTYNGTLVEFYKECLSNDDCFSVPKMQVNNSEIDSSKPLNAILISVIILFAVSIVFAKHLSR